MNKLLLTTCLVITGFGPVVWGQSTPQLSPLPSPLQLRLPEGTAASVTVKRLKPLTEIEQTDPIRQAWNPDLLSATLARAGRNLVISQQWEGDRRSSVAAVGGHILYQPSLRYPDDIQVNGSGAPDLRRSDFPWLSWLDSEHFVEEEKEGGRKLLRFSRNPPDNETTRAKRLKSAEAAANAVGELKPEHRKSFIEAYLKENRAEEVVWLDPQSLLPLKSTDGILEFTYSYRKSTPSDTQLPPEFIRHLQALQKVE